MLYARGEVDYAGLLVQAGNAAAAGEPAFDHVLVDDYQDSTAAAERLLVELRPASLVVAGDAGSHVFSFQGFTDRPLLAFDEDFPGAAIQELTVRHRVGDGPALDAWAGLHSSEEHAAVARELRRMHVEDGVPWRDLAVIVRRGGAEVAGLLRALDDAGVPNVVPETRLALQTQPATFPYVLALRWLADPGRRDALIESILTSDLAGLSPAAARGLLRAAGGAGRRPPPRSSSTTDSRRTRPPRSPSFAASSLAPRRAARSWTRSRCCGASFRARAGSSRGAGRRADARASTRSWRSRPPSSARTSASSRPSPPSWNSWSGWRTVPGQGPAGAEDVDAVRVLTAHGATGREFDSVVVVVGAGGQLPQPVAARADVRPRRARPAEHAGRAQPRPPAGRAAPVRRRGHPRAAPGPAHGEPCGKRRDGAYRALPLRRRAGGRVAVVPGGSAAGEPLSVEEATAAWRRPREPRGPPGDTAGRAARPRGAGSRPARWWFQREWTDTDRPLHEDVRVSYSRLEKLENCALQYVLGEELGLEDRAGYHAWVGHLVHTADRGLRGRSDRPQPRGAGWRPPTSAGARRSSRRMAVSEAFRRAVTERMLPAWVEEYGAAASLAKELRFEFEVDGATVTGYIDRIGRRHDRRHRSSPTTRRGRSANTASPEQNLQLGIYYLAVNAVPELAPVPAR